MSGMSRKKNKTSAAFEIKPDEAEKNIEKNIEMSRSINIIALKTGNRISSTSALKRRITDVQPICRHPKKTHKLSLNLANGAVITFDEEFKKDIGTTSSFNTFKNIDPSETIERIRKANLIKVENSTIQTDYESFSQICNEFLKKIEDLERENQSYYASIKKY